MIVLAVAASSPLVSAGRVECGLHEVRAGRSRQKRLSLERCPLVIPLVHHLMRAVVMYLALSSAVADAAPLKEVFVTPWIAYGTAVGPGVCEESPDDSHRRDQRMSGGVEVLTTVSTRCGVLGSLERSVVGEWCGPREARVTTVTLGFLALTDRTGRTRWDQGFSVGVMWPDPWGTRSANILGRWRVASAIQVHRWAAIELAGGLQGDTGEFHGMRGIFGRVGLRLGPREPAN